MKRDVPRHPSDGQAHLYYGRQETLDSTRTLRPFGPTRPREFEARPAQQRSVGSPEAMEPDLG